MPARRARPHLALAHRLRHCSLLALRAEGVGTASGEVSLARAFAAWSLVRARLVPITGRADREVALRRAQARLRAGNAQARRPLVYRFLTVVPSIVLGLVSVATYNVKNPKRKPARTPNEAALQPPRSG